MIPDPPSDSDYSFDGKCFAQVIEGDVDLSRHCTTTRQYNTGSCVGNATADAVEILNSIEGRPPVQLSRLFVYSICRSLMDDDGDGMADINDRDEGTYIRLAFSVISKFGICREDIPIEQGGWPYDLSLLYRNPSMKALRAATGHRIKSYYRITASGQERCEEVIAALRSMHPVVFGTELGSEFYNLPGNHDPLMPPVQESKTGELGRHAMIIVGYRATHGFLVKNSWGAEWGNTGFCWMTPEYISWQQTKDLWVPTRGTTF